MHKFMIMFRHPADEDLFENSYNDLLALVERMPHITRRQVNHILGSPVGRAPYHRILEVYYHDRAAMEESLRSKAGQEAGNQIQTFPAGTFELFFAEVYEALHHE